MSKWILLRLSRIHLFLLQLRNFLFSLNFFTQPIRIEMWISIKHRLIINMFFDYCTYRFLLPKVSWNVTVCQSISSWISSLCFPFGRFNRLVLLKFQLYKFYSLYIFKVQYVWHNLTRRCFCRCLSLICSPEESCSWKASPRTRTRLNLNTSRRVVKSS